MKTQTKNGSVERQAKAVSASRITMPYQSLPHDTNRAGNVHGGAIMKLIDSAAGAVAMRHCRSNCVTASMDRMDFYEPVFVGDMITVWASVNYVGTSSLEVGAKVESEDLFTGHKRHTASAYLTFVALDKDGKPALAPTLILETPEDERRNRAAAIRWEIRKRVMLESKARYK